MLRAEANYTEVAVNKYDRACDLAWCLKMQPLLF